MIFGSHLSTERKKKKMSAEKLAAISGVSRSYITLIENGKRLPAAKVLPRIAAALGVRADVVLNWYLDDVRERVQKHLSVDPEA